MMASPIKTPELHYSMNLFLIILDNDVCYWVKWLKFSHSKWFEMYNLNMCSAFARKLYWSVIWKANVKFYTAFKLLGNIALWQGSYSRPVYDLQRRPMAEYLVDMEMLVFGYRSFSGLRNTTCQVSLTKRLQIFWKELLHFRHHDFDYCFSVVCGGTRTLTLKMHYFHLVQRHLHLHPPAAVCPENVSLRSWREWVRARNFLRQSG